MILLAIILFLTIFEALHEGIALRGKNEGDSKLGTAAGVVEMFKLTGLALILPFLMWTDHYEYYFNSYRHFFLWFLPSYIIGWISLRYGIFDVIHNLSAGIDWKYIGKTKLYDKFLRWLTKKQPPFHFHLWTRAILLVLGVALLIRL